MGSYPVVTSGYRRVLPGADPCAVAWWYVRRYPDGVVFARGGRCRTSKLARSLIHAVEVQARHEEQEFALVSEQVHHAA